MVDPALLQILAEVNRPVPAIVQPAAGLDGGPISYAYAILMKDAEREFADWVAKRPMMRAMLQDAMRQIPEGFTPEMFTSVIEPFEQRVRAEARVTARLKRVAERRPLTDPLQRRVQAWLFDLQRRHYEAAEELALFLRAMRAEVNPDSRGGPSFDNVEDMQRYLLSDVA